MLRVCSARLAAQLLQQHRPGKERCKPERISLLNREKTRSYFVNGSLLELVHSQGNEERTYSSFPSRFYVQGEYTRQES